MKKFDDTFEGKCEEYLAYLYSLASIIYEASGPVMVGYRDGNNVKNMCRMFDCQSLFGDAHWAYSKLKYKVWKCQYLRSRKSPKFKLTCKANPI